MKIGFIGTGKMASALVRAMLENGISSKNIFCSDREKEILSKTKKQYDIEMHHDNKEVCKRADVIFLCVKPQEMNSVLDEIKDVVKGKLVVSIAAGVKIKTIEKRLDEKVIRIMPNTPCLVGEMAAGYSLGKKASKKDAEVVEKLLSKSGVLFLVDEGKLDIITALSGSGPGFFAYFAKAIAHAGIEKGLEPEVAYKLIAQTCLGTGKLLLDMSPKELIKRVASPNGTTEAGLKVLEDNKVEKILKEMVEAAKKKSEELGK